MTTSWVFLAISSYFLIAVVSVIDKYLLANRARNALVYAFYVGILSSFSAVLWIFGFSFLDQLTTILAFLAGLSWFLAIFLLYSSLIKGSVSRIVSIVGGISPIFVLVLSYIFLGEQLPALWLWAFLFLILGSILLALGKGTKLSLVLFASAFFFALHFFLSKLVYLETSFLNGFVWIRIGLLISALFVFLIPSFRKKIAQSSLRTSKKLFLFFVSNKALSATAMIILNYSIALGSVVIINALQGVQYASVFILVFFLSIFFPKIVKESFAPKIFLRKILGILLVSLGVVFLFL